VGEWKDDKMHGQGTYIYPNGNVVNGIWADGEFVKASSGSTESRTSKINGYRS
jgi:hypothetical protein